MIFSGKKSKWLGTRKFTKSMLHTIQMSDKKLIDVGGDQIPDYDLTNDRKLR